MTTGNLAIANLALSAQFDADTKLTAVNRAISSAWPMIKLIKRDVSITLDSDTFTYTPTATDVNAEWGFSVAYVDVTFGPPELTQKVSQRRSGTGWQIITAPEVALGYSGRGLILEYNAAVPQVANLDASIDLPIGYLDAAIAYFLTRSKILAMKQSDVENFKAIWKDDKDELQRALIRYARGSLEATIPQTYAIGSPTGFDSDSYYRTPLGM